MTDKLTPAMNGREIICARCYGGGLTGGCDDPFNHTECPDCGGSGRNWQYPKGAVARYYSGPLLGRYRITPKGREALK